MKALLDTNVLASAITSPRGAPRALLEAAILGQLEICTSQALMAELEECLLEIFHFERLAAAATCEAIERLATMVEPIAVPAVCRDPDDDQVLAAALTGGVTHLVTRDKDLLSE